MGQLGMGVVMKMDEKNVRRPVPVEQRIGVEFPRYFTARLDAGKTPYDDVKWDAARRETLDRLKTLIQNTR